MGAINRDRIILKDELDASEKLKEEEIRRNLKSPSPEERIEMLEQAILFLSME